jgi:O-antigen/teichoic acid export membrane protein
MEQGTARSDAAAPAADRASDVRHVARSGVLQLLSAVGQGLLPVTHILVARLFGAATFGAYQASLAILELLTRAGMVGSMHGMHRFIPAHRAAGDADLEQSALGTGLRMTVAVSCVLSLALGVLAPLVARWWHAPSLTATLPIMAPAVLLAATTLVLIAATMGAKVARMSLYVRGIAEPILLMLAVLLASRLGDSLRNLAVAHVASAFVVATLAVAACARVFGGSRLRQSLSAPRHPAFVRFALPLGASDLMSAVLNRADAIIVATYAGLDALAVYTAAEFITRLIANPRYLFDPIIAPVLAEALHMQDRARVHYNLALVTRWVITACAPIAVTVIVLRAEILGLYGAAFTKGTGVLVILAIHHLIVGCVGLTPYVVAMGGRARLVLLNNMAAAGLNIALGLVLVPRFGITGAAISVLVSVAAFQLALTIEAWVLERVHPFTQSQLKPVAAALVALGVESLLYRWIGNGAARVTFVIVAGAASYLLALLAFGLAPEERNALRRVIARVRPRHAAP